MNKNFNTHKHVLNSLRVFIFEMAGLAISPTFILLTFLGNMLIVGFSSIFYLLEFEKNPKIHGFLDALWWGFATATTTGYGDITPVPNQGKVLGILLMLSGTALFAMFTALFAEAIITGVKQKKP